MKNDDVFQSLHEGGLLLLANCWDGGSARLAQAAGARALATSSASLAWANGYADGSHRPPGLLLQSVRGIARVSDLPLTVDIEDGYSDEPEQVASLVRELMDAGAVGINIEDGAGRPELLARKIAALRAAADAAGIRLYINARTDVFLRGLAPEGERVAETLRRAARYREAGASGLFVPLMRDEEDIAAIVRAAGMPVNAMALPGLASPERLRELGVRRLSAGSATGEAAYAAAHAAIAVFLESGQVTPASLGYGALNGLTVAVG